MQLCWLSLYMTMVVSAPQPDLAEYIQKTESAFAWQQTGRLQYDNGQIYNLRLVSQIWKEIQWEHNLQVFVPADIYYPETMLILVTGGSTGSQPSDNDNAIGIELARRAGSVLAVLYQVPNQPLYEGRKEDDLIAHTFEKYLESEDSSWLLLFPMVKSATQAMTALTQFTQQELAQKIDNFVITGASKRGWTSWLTAAVDPRIKATIPLVIDVLNMPAQMEYQKATWGHYSEQINDYTERGLQDVLGTGEEKSLTALVDPYSYRSQLTMPKLSVIGTNDPYWVLDALNLYWDDLAKPNYVLYVPNSGHGLDDQERTIAGVTGFYRYIASGQPLPKLEWSYHQEGDNLYLQFSASQKPAQTRLWITSSTKRDFREANWVSVPVVEKENGFLGQVEIHQKQYVALFGEYVFMIDGQPCPLSTQVNIGTINPNQEK